MLGVPGATHVSFPEKNVNIIRIFLDEAKAYLGTVSPAPGRA